jgi:hypothetical protein
MSTEINWKLGEEIGWTFRPGETNGGLEPTILSGPAQSEKFPADRDKPDGEEQPPATVPDPYTRNFSSI